MKETLKKKKKRKKALLFKRYPFREVTLKSCAKSDISRMTNFDKSNLKKRSKINKNEKKKKEEKERKKEGKTALNVHFSIFIQIQSLKTEIN